jgi:hypothetical protein
MRAINPDAKVNGAFGDGAPAGIASAATTGLACDADLVVSGQRHWFPYVDAFDKLGMLLVDTGVLKRQCEVFVRGHDVPWSFEMMFAMPWAAFYQAAEPQTFQDAPVFCIEHTKKA